MQIFTDTAIAILLIGIVCMFIPRKWYKSSQLDFRVGGVWLILLAFGLLLVSLLGSGILKLFKF